MACYVANMDKRITARKTNVGGTCQEVYFAYADGVMLRDKIGVGRRFKSEAAALKAAEQFLATRRELPQSTA